MADVLIFSAHPDDAEFGMGGTLLKMLEQGKSVTVCVLTKGQAGTEGTVQDRVNEMKSASQYAGFELEMLDFVDCKVFDNFESRKALAEVIRKHKPKTIFTPYHTNNGYHKNGMAHPDHLATGQITKSAARYAKFKGLEGIKGEAWSAERIIYYMVPMNLTPTIVLDVKDQMENLIELMKCHQTQTNLVQGKFVELLTDFRKQQGLFNALEYAETFYMEEPFEIEAKDL
ncbi:MAG: PIG-L deacetylase family protein [Candidatus Pacearchaeota archaeon]